MASLADINNAPRGENSNTLGDVDEKDTNAPKRPMNAYFLYSNANRARIKAENPDAKFTEIPGIASAEFKSLSEKEASKWHKAAAEDKARYQAEMENNEPPEEDDDDVDEVIVDAGSFSVGDSVQIMGLVGAPQYNDMRGIVVSDFDRTTNRCGVKVHGGKGPILALQVHNLTMIRKAKQSSSVDVKFPLRVNFDDRKHSVAVNKAERSKLQRQNMAILHDFGAHADSVNFGALHATNKCIIRKWSEQASTTGFVQFLNGITTDCRAENMQLVSLRDALVNIDQWKVDWDKKLELSEIKMVKDPTWRGVFLRSTGVDVRNSAHDISSLQMTSSPPAKDYGLTTINSYADSHSTKQVAKFMKDFRKCKKGAVNLLLSNKLDELNSFQQALLDNGLISVILGFLSQCEHEDFNHLVDKVKGNLRTPLDWMEILVYYSIFEQCRVEIANGIQAVVRCLCDDTKRLFFKSNKYWHQALSHFVTLLSSLIGSLDHSSSEVTASTVCHILLQNEGFLENMIQKTVWSLYRPDIVKEQSHHCLSDIIFIESFARRVISNIIFIGLERNVTETDAELNRLTVHEAFSQDGLDLITTIAKTPVVSKAYDPECKVNYVLGMIRMLKLVNSVDRRDQLSFLNSMFACNADYVDNGIIAEVIELGSKFIADIDDAMSISELSYSMLVRKNAQGNVFPIDKRLAFAIKSGLLEMCVEFIMRFACDPTIQSIACDAQRNQLMEALVFIARFIYAVGFHQKTAKAIRDHRSQIIEALSRLSAQVENEQSTHSEKPHICKFVDLLSSIMKLNEGSCSRCNKPIEWHTALFCEGCRRVAYCGKKCQKNDWCHGTHSWDCSFLACSADMMRLTTFEVKSSRNKSMLTGLRNNIVTNQKKLFLRHEVSILSRLLTLPDRSDYIAVFVCPALLLFDQNQLKQSISIVHYHDELTCLTERKWFEEFRSPDKVICLFTSSVFNGEFDEEGNLNIIRVWAAFPLRQAR